MADSHPLTRYRTSQEPPLSEADLARKLGVGRAAVHRWENGQRKIDIKLISHVSDMTGIPRKELRPDLFAAHEKLFGGGSQ